MSGYHIIIIVWQCHTSVYKELCFNTTTNIIFSISVHTLAHESCFFWKSHNKRSLSACSNAYDSHLGSHINDVLLFGSTEINVYGHRTQENTIFCLKKVWYTIVFSGVQWPYTIVSVAACGNISWVYDPSLVPYALEQPGILRSPAYKHIIDV